MQKRKIVAVVFGLIFLSFGGIKVYYHIGNVRFYNEMNEMKTEFTIQTPIEHKTIEKEGDIVHYFVSGNPHGETILFVHQAFGDHHCFDKQIDYFSSQYRVITFDMLGHGLTGTGKSKNKIIATSSHIAEILNAEKIENVHIMGVSLGSLIAQDFALNYPERMLSLTCLGGYNINKEQKEISKAQQKEMFHWLFKIIFSMDAFRRHIAEVSVIGKSEQAHVYKSAQFFTRKSFSVMLGTDKLIANRTDVEYTYPLLILVGENDMPLAVSSAKQWHQDVPASQFRIIENAGHCANLDNAHSFNELLMNFLKK